MAFSYRLLADGCWLMAPHHLIHHFFKDPGGFFFRVDQVVEGDAIEEVVKDELDHLPQGTGGTVYGMGAEF